MNELIFLISTFSTRLYTNKEPLIGLCFKNEMYLISQYLWSQLLGIFLLSSAL